MAPPRLDGIRIARGADSPRSVGGSRVCYWRAMQARDQLREWLEKELPVYQNIVQMGHAQGYTLDYGPVLPLLDALQASAPASIADDLRAARVFLGERHPPPWRRPHETTTFVRDRAELELITEWLRVAGEL